MRELRAAMNAVDPTLQLTFDVMPGIENYDVAALTADDAADAMFVMGYEYLTGSAAQHRLQRAAGRRERAST